MSRAPVQSRPSLPTSDGLESSHPTCDAESQKEGTARLEGEAARLGELFPYASPLTAGCGVSPALEDQVRSSSNLASVERTWAHRANCGPSQSRTYFPPSTLLSLASQGPERVAAPLRGQQRVFCSHQQIRQNSPSRTLWAMEMHGRPSRAPRGNGRRPARAVASPFELQLHWLW